MPWGTQCHSHNCPGLCCSSRAGAVCSCHHSLIVGISSPLMAPRLILRISLSQAVTPRPGQLTLEAAVHRGPQTGGGPQQREKRPGHRRHLRSSPRIGAASEILHQPVRWCVFTRALTSAAPRTSPPGSSVHRIFQARILEWVAFPSPGDLRDPGIEPCISCIGRQVLYH